MGAPLDTVKDHGRLDDLALPDLLASICGRQETGVLHLTRPPLSKSIYIEGGRILFATSNDPDDRLGELLLRRGVLRAHHLEKALDSLGRPKRLGAVLVEMGYLKPEELVSGVVQQVQEIIYGLFLWYDGEYRFARGPLPSRELITLKLSTPEAILTGIGRIDRWWRVLRGVGGLDTVYQLGARHSEILRDMRPQENHKRIVQALEQPLSVRDLCDLGILPDFQTCATLWAFRVIGVVEALYVAAEVQLPSPAPEETGDAPAAARAGAPARSGRTRSGAGRAGGGTDDQSGGVAVIEAVEVEVLEEPADEAPAGRASAPADGGTDGQARGVAVMEAVEVEGGDAFTTMMPAVGAGAAAAAESPVTPGAEKRDSGAAAPAAPPGPSTGAQPLGRSDARMPTAVNETIVEVALISFNDKHQVVHRFLRENLGDKAHDLVRRSVKSIQSQLPGLFKGAECGADGSFDVQVLTRNIVSTRLFGFAAALELLIELELDAVASLLGPAARRKVSASLKTIAG